eukprot:Skav216548  [mRNA]  locus=scaffold1776:258883:279066:- [translate_table: standard]
MLAVQLNPSALRYAEEEFRSDPELVLGAVQSDEMTLGFATESLRSDGPFVHKALQRNSAAFPYAAEHLKENKRFLSEALKIPGVLKHAAEEVRRDRELVVLAIESDGAAMCYAAQSLQQDMAFVLEAAEANPASLQYVLDDFWQQKDFVMKAVEAAGERSSIQDGDLRRNSSALNFVPDELRSDREALVKDRLFILAAVRRNGAALAYAPQRQATKVFGEALRFASDELQKELNRFVVLAAVQNDGVAFAYAAAELQNGREAGGGTSASEQATRRASLVQLEISWAFLKTGSAKASVLLEHQDFLLQAIEAWLTGQALTGPAAIPLLQVSPEAFAHIPEDLKKDPRWINGSGISWKLLARLSW